ncbi:MAG TPA: glycosyltransferase family 4 protein [Clostridiales bacterium]|nr:glycosyltransferase family 4 protein [Clostridiales bacterium]
MRLNVGLFNDSFPPTIDGVANAVFNYAKIISEKFGDVVVATPKYPDVVDDYNFEVFRYGSIPVIGPLPYRAGNPFSPSAIKYLRSKKFDIIHVHSPFASSVLVKLITNKPAYKVPVVLTYHTKFDFDIAKYIKLPLMQNIAKKFVLYNINQANEVWVVSKGAGENLRSLGYKGDYLVMPNGTDFEKGKAPKDEIEKLRQKHGILECQKVMLFVGRMMWYKNVKLLLDSLDLVKKANIDFKAIFVGEGTDRADIEKYAQKIGLKDFTVFTGAIRDRNLVRAYFSLADLFLFPSTYDTSGLVVKEAAACECPSLLIKGSCAAEDVQDGFTGLLAEETAESCGEKIISALKNDEFLKTLGKNASEYVYTSWNDAVSKAYDRYQLILEKWDAGNRK